MVNKMDMKSGLVVPFYVTVETHGTEGQVLNVEEKVKEVKEDIVVALGLSRSLVAGDGPNFATASVSMQKMMVMIREIKQAARAILDWIFDDWLELRGHAGQEHPVPLQRPRPHATRWISRSCSSSSTTASSSAAPACSSRWTSTRTSRRPTGRTKGKSVDLLDEKQVKPIVDMVVAGIMGVETAQEMLGLDPAKNPAGGQAEAAARYSSADCAARCATPARYFDDEHNRCGVTQAETHVRRPGLPLL